MKEKFKNLIKRVEHKLRELVDMTIKRPIQAFRAFCFYVGLSVVSIIALIACIIFLFFSTIPDVENFSFKQLKKLGEQKVLDEIDPAERNNYHWKRIEDINRDLIYTIVYSEDGTYFKHDGIYFNAILRSMAQNFKKKDYSFGGSTITQQVAKNLFLTQEKSLIRKLKEIILAKRLDRKFSKNEVLEIYLNTAEFGPDIYGVGHASVYYFKKKASKINPAEGAYLALMLPSPRRNHYAIYKNKNITKAKRAKLRRILTSMFSEGLISQMQLKGYLAYEYCPRPKPQYKSKKKRKRSWKKK